MSQMATQFVPQQYDIPFFVDIYLPELKKVTKDIHISLAQKFLLSKKFFGAALKIGYSFMWQKYSVKQYFSDKTGAYFAPYFNTISNLISGLPQADNIKSEWGVYPGQF
jgi:hypothetical protein